VTAACSGDDGDSDEDAGRDEVTSTTEVPSFTGDADSPFCTLLRDVDIDSVLSGEPGTPETLQAGFQQLVTVLDQAAELAPADIAEDTATIADGMAALNEAMAAAGYDYDVLAVSPEARGVSEAVNDPAFSVAGARVQAYRQQVCGL
jgi:hypothetical protein